MNVNRNQVREWLVIAITFIVFSVIAFAAPFTRNNVFWVSYGFGAVAVLAQIVVFQKAFHEGETVTSKFFGFPIARIGIIWMAVQVVLSLVFMALAVHIATWVAVVICVVVIGVAAVGLIAADAARDEVERVEVKQKADVRLMRRLQAEAKAMAAGCGDAATKKLLQELGDELRFSDPVSGPGLMEIEQQLEAELQAVQTALDAGDYSEAVKCIGIARRTLAKRNVLCKAVK